jgi:HPt (histidine-containing phosphotransfer) domain-containing protein
MTAVDCTVLDTLAEEIGDREIVRSVVGAYLGEMDTRMLAIVSAVAAGDVQATVMAAHTLKSTSVTVGAGALAAPAKELEFLARGGTLDGAGDLVARLRDAVPAVRASLATW